MEEQYWKQFMKSGDVTDYLGYKMEMYGHQKNDRHQNVTEEVNKNSAAGRLNCYNYQNKQE